MNERAKIIAEQALSLPANEREELCRVLAASLGGHEPNSDDGLSDEAKDYLKAAWDKGIASGPGLYGTIEDIIAEARRRFASERA
ncbi:MAG: hypothetical protein ACLPPF_07700 [Rhodomicrobium sp.]